METRYDELIQGLREATQPDRHVPAAFLPYVEKVREHAYRVTDADVAALTAAGFSEDEIFEQTVSAAAAAALARLQAGLRALE